MAFSFSLHYLKVFLCYNFMLKNPDNPFRRSGELWGAGGAITYCNCSGQSGSGGKWLKGQWNIFLFQTNKLVQNIFLGTWGGMFPKTNNDLHNFLPTTVFHGRQDRSAHRNEIMLKHCSDFVINCSRSKRGSWLLNIYFEKISIFH